MLAPRPVPAGRPRLSHLVAKVLREGNSQLRESGAIRYHWKQAVAQKQPTPD
jgi:hypothetical protein